MVCLPGTIYTTVPGYWFQAGRQGAAIVNEPKLTFATGKRYDTRFLLDGVVRVRDFDITYPDIGTPPSPFFHSMVTELPYDIGEQAFAHYLLAKDQGQPLTAIPVFPSRFFPHFGVSVHREAGIDS